MASLFDVQYTVKDGMRDMFLKSIEMNQIAEKSRIETGNISYEYSIPNELNNVVNLREIWNSREDQTKHTLSPHFQILKEIKEKYVLDTQMKIHEVYVVKKNNRPVNKSVVVPGSKSMTNRALLLAAMSNEKSRLRGVLFSDDSRHFLECLESIGFKLEINEEDNIVDIYGCGGEIPLKEGSIDVGSAGTAARFLTAMLALSDGSYTINCSEQMERRPMKDLFDVLTMLGAKFEYLHEKFHLPVKVTGNGRKSQNIDMDISKSTQYLSAMLMVTPILNNDINIHITSEKKDGSYIRITRKMLKEFGVKVEFDGENYKVFGGQHIHIGDYYIEPDVSAACYFYGMAALLGGSMVVKNVHFNSTQGDLKFLEVLEKMGCILEDTEEGIKLTGSGTLSGIDIDMNDFSDQALTLAAIAPFADSTTWIRNIGHIRGQECNRMSAIINELSKCGVNCKEIENDIIIEPGIVGKAVIETYDDHRVAMAFTLMGLKCSGIIIDNPMCCRKTFEGFYDVLETCI